MSASAPVSAGIVRMSSTCAPAGMFRPTSVSVAFGSWARRCEKSSLDHAVIRARVYALTNSVRSCAVMVIASKLPVPSDGRYGSGAAAARAAAAGGGDARGHGVEVALAEFRHLDLRGLRDVQFVAAGGKAELPQRDLRVDARIAAGLGRDRADELDLRAGRDVQ